MVAAELAAHYPNRVGRLVLLAPIGLWRDDEPVADMFAVHFRKLPGLLYADSEVKARMAPGPAVLEVEAEVKRVQGMTTVAKFTWPIPDRGLRRRLYRITAPTSSSSESSTPSCRRATRTISSPASRTRWESSSPEAGHMVPVERPAEVLAAIDEFLGA